MTKSQIRGESMYADGIFNTSVARIWIFIAFLINFGSLIGSIWMFFAYYVAEGRNIKPGLSILLQNLFIFISTHIWKFGRNENLWNN